jgi:hypothetical protein
LLPNHFDIINVNSDEEMISDVDAGIWLKGNEPKVYNDPTEEKLPNACRLFEPVKGLAKMKDFVRELYVDKAFRLVNVDIDVAFSM